MINEKWSISLMILVVIRLFTLNGQKLPFSKETHYFQLFLDMLFFSSNTMNIYIYINHEIPRKISTIKGLAWTGLIPSSPNE